MALIRQFSAGVILVNFLNQSVDLSNALLRFFQFPTFCREPLFVILCVSGPLFAGKFFLEYLHIQHNTLHAFQNKLLHHFFTDVMCRTNIRILAV